MEERNWADLPWDTLSVVFEKVGPFDVLISAQQVCSQWWKLAHDPRVWIRIDFTGIYYDLEMCCAKMALDVVNRSSGGLVEFAFADYGNDELLKRIAETSTKLRVLRLISCGEVSEKAFMEACENFPLLEELEISHCMSLTSTAIESVGHSCPSLKKFRFNCTDILFAYSQYNNEALAISKCMPELRELQLLGNKLDDNGLCALLDGCPYLESLDIRHCFNLVLGGDLKKRCQGLKFFRLPKDSIDDHPYAQYYALDIDQDDDDLFDPEIYDLHQDYDSDLDDPEIHVDFGHVLGSDDVLDFDSDLDDPEIYVDFGHVLGSDDVPDYDYNLDDPEIYEDFGHVLGSDDVPDYDYNLDDPEIYEDFGHVPGSHDVEDFLSSLVYQHDDDDDNVDFGFDFGF